MRPENMAGLVARWVRFYTRGLPPAASERRVEEIDADVRDQIADERAHGASDRRIARSIAWRLVRGLAADAAWRRSQQAAARAAIPAQRMRGRSLSRSAARVAVGVAAILALPFVAMLFSDEVVWSLADFVLAGVLLTTIGAVVELAVRKAGNRMLASGIAILGIAAAILGEADDAPGLVLLGILLVASACLLGVRTAQHDR